MKAENCFRDFAISRSRKAIGFLMISGGREVHQYSFLNSLNVRREIWGRSLIDFT